MLQVKHKMSKIDFFDATKEHGFFSNFYKGSTPLSYQGLLFETSEHLYQWFKFLYTDANEATRKYAEIVRTARTANQSRLLAQQKIGGGYEWRTALNPIIKKSIDEGVTPDPKWEEVKLDRMRTALRVKFSDAIMRSFLVKTGNAVLREASPYDSFWGIGRNGNGQNWLGRLLMELREELAQDLSPTIVSASSNTLTSKPKRLRDPSPVSPNKKAAMCKDCENN